MSGRAARGRGPAQPYGFNYHPIRLILINPGLILTVCFHLCRAASIRTGARYRRRRWDRRRENSPYPALCARAPSWSLVGVRGPPDGQRHCAALHAVSLYRHASPWHRNRIPSPRPGHLIFTSLIDVLCQHEHQARRPRSHDTNMKLTHISRHAHGMGCLRERTIIKCGQE